MEEIDLKRKLRLKKIYLDNIKLLKKSRDKNSWEKIIFFETKIRNLKLQKNYNCLVKGDNKSKLIELNFKKKTSFIPKYFSVWDLNDDEIDREVLIGFEREKY